MLQITAYKLLGTLGFSVSAASWGRWPFLGDVTGLDGSRMRNVLSVTRKVEEWHVICGKFLAINATNMSCACPRSPRGLSPAAHLGDGTFDLILIRKCSRFNFLRFLLRHTNQYDQVSGQVDAAARTRSFPRVVLVPHCR
ncbi:Hypothetical predicted protein, partial [Marmota monax]